MLDDAKIFRRNNGKHDNRCEFMLARGVILRGFNRAAARVFARVTATF